MGVGESVGLEFKTSKCQVVGVTTTGKAINLVYTLHGYSLEVVTRAKYLAVRGRW